MKKKIDFHEILFEEFYVFNKVKIRMIDFLALALLTGACILMRVSLLPFASNDYNVFLKNWFNMLKENGGFAALGITMGDYTPPYFYILAALTYIPVDSLISIKLVSCIFDFALAIVVLQMVYFKYQSVPKAILGYGIALTAPTILLNSAYWGQCDVIFTLFLLLCLYNFMKNKPVWATVFFAIAFCFKLQAIFLAPFLVLMWLKKRMKFWHFFLIPAVYIISIIPAWIAGRKFFELLTIYISQAGQYKKMAMLSPNLYIFIGELVSEPVGTAAVCICFAAVLTALYLLAIKKFELTHEILISLALFFILLLPSLLPYMHERYFFAADVFSIIYGFYRPKKFYVPILISFSSLLCYLPYLFGSTPISLNIAAVIMLFALIIVCYDLVKQIYTPKKKSF